MADERKHGPLYPERVLYPVTLPRRHKAISRAVDIVVSSMEPQRLLDEAIARIAEFRVGQTVLCYERKHRITKVSGEVFGIMGQRPKIWLRYHGERVKADGSLMGREKRLYDIKQIQEQS